MEKPILFNTEMVRAILDGRKSCTRRVIKPHYREDEYGFNVVTNAATGQYVRVEKFDENENSWFADGSERYVIEPYKPGDILYVRETWGICPDLMGEYPGYIYAASIPAGDLQESKHKHFHWCPSIHMPKDAARIWLRVTDVRAERLQDITNDDAMKEGALPDVVHYHAENRYELYITQGYINGFKSVWDSTIKKPDLGKYGWAANPWVWVIEFERCEKPEENE